MLCKGRDVMRSTYGIYHRSALNLMAKPSAKAKKAVHRKKMSKQQKKQQLAEKKAKEAKRVARMACRPEIQPSTVLCQSFS